MSSPIWPWRTRAGDRAPVDTSANSSCTSRALTSRPLMRYADPASRSIRRAISIDSSSLNCGGALRLALSSATVTSAMLRAGRAAVPEKITSSMSAARMFLVEFSPITQRSASSRLDLPHPFGPTIPVRPASIRSSVGSTNDLKPDNLSRVNFILPHPPGRGSPSRSCPKQQALHRSAF